MLHLVVELVPEKWDEKNGLFIPPVTTTLQLEHSLVSLSKWESKWCKPFLSKQEKTVEEIVDYIKCMTITQNVKPEVYNMLNRANIELINEYINAPMTATSFSDDPNGKRNREVITSELIYYWMVALGIPSEYQKWHLNRLLTLIRVCEVKNRPPKKQGAKQTWNQYAALNAARRKQFNSKG